MISLKEKLIARKLAIAATPQLEKSIASGKKRKDMPTFADQQMQEPSDKRRKKTKEPKINIQPPAVSVDSSARSNTFTPLQLQMKAKLGAAKFRSNFILYS